MEEDPTWGVNFINVLRTAFTRVNSKSVKNTVKSSVSFKAFGIYERKSYTENVDEIDGRTSKFGLNEKTKEQKYAEEVLNLHEAYQVFPVSLLRLISCFWFHTSG
jgi:hypothetical protein